MPHTKPTRTITFDAKIRSEWLSIDASAWGDKEGIYKQSIDAAWLGDCNVIGLLTDQDIEELESMIENEISALDQGE